MKRIFSTAICTLLVLYASAQAVITNRSVTPPLISINPTDFLGVQVYSLISTADTFPFSPGFRFAGGADGGGIRKNTNGTYTMVTNHEELYSISRVTLDSTFKPVSGEYLLNSDAGMWRLCSGTLAVPEVHGFGPTFITGAESGYEDFAHAVPLYSPPITDPVTSTNTTLARGIGHWRIENAVPLPLATFNKTVVLIGDDDGGPNGGQLGMYIADAVGDLNNGRLYAMRRTDLNQRELDVLPGVPVPVEFVEIPGYMNMSGWQIDQYCGDSLHTIEIQRIEDVDYRKGNAQAAREIYFAATGLANADTADRTLYGRLYRLQLDSANPMSGLLTCVLDGDGKNLVNPGKFLFNPDNVCATEDYVYVQEDPGGWWTPSYAPYLHDAAVHQYDIQNGDCKILCIMDHHRHSPDSMTYNTNGNATVYAMSGLGSWEYGAMLDISAETGIENTFTLNLQTHTWYDTRFHNLDGGTLNTWYNQGSMIVMLTNVPRIKPQPPAVPMVFVCQGESATLTATGGSTFWQTNGTTYNWYTTASGGTPFFTGAVYTTPPLTASAVYFVETVVSGFTSIRTAAVVGVSAAPPVPTISVFGNTLVSSAATGNQWYRNNLVIPNATAQAYTITQSGFYAVENTQFGCTVISNDTLVLLSDVDEMTSNGNWMLYPNPGDGYFNLQQLTGSSEPNDIQITDMLGNTIAAFRSNTLPKQAIDLRNQQPGMYFIHIRNGESHLVLKAIKQ